MIYVKGSDIGTMKDFEKKKGLYRSKLGRTSSKNNGSTLVGGEQ